MDISRRMTSSLTRDLNFPGISSSSTMSGCYSAPRGAGSFRSNVKGTCSLRKDSSFVNIPEQGIGIYQIFCISQCWELQADTASDGPLVRPQHVEPILLFSVLARGCLYRPHHFSQNDITRVSSRFFPHSAIYPGFCRLPQLTDKVLHEQVPQSAVLHSLLVSRPSMIH